MKSGNLYDAIFERKSIRKYDLKPLDDSILDEISEHINNVKPLYTDIKIKTHLAKRDEVKILIPVKAPHYLLFYSENKEGYLTNAGYILQHIDLFLSSKGLGSCYLGMAQPKEVPTDSSGLEFVMILAFGNTSEPVHRNNVSDFNRKSIEQITDITNNNKLLEVARLAPSATNNQPWFFTGGNGSFNAYCIKQNVIKAMMYKKMNKIDMGIALCHIEVASEHFGKKISYVNDKMAQEQPPKGYYYVTTINMR